MEETRATNETQPFLSEDWFDPLETAVRGGLRGFIEEMLEAELDAALRRGRYDRHGTTRGHRHGHRERQLVGTFGPAPHTKFLTVPASRQVLHIQVTEHPTAMWAAQQIVECCGWDQKPPRFLIHDRDSRYGELFDRRPQGLGITQIHTPFRAPRANSIAERWVRSARQECLDHTFIFGERHLRQVLAEYVAYFNQWRPHRSIGQRAPCAPPPAASGSQSGTVMATPVLGGLHHVYQIAA